MRTIGNKSDIGHGIFSNPYFAFPRVPPRMYLSSALRVLMCEISNQRIRVPSTLRLLRLINAKSCERGKECFCYNLETETSGPLILDGMRPYGMAICTPCVHALSSCWGNDCPGSLRSEAICTHGWSRVLCYPQVEQATGEAVGPMILFRDIKQIQYSYSDNEKREEVLKSTIASAEAQAFGPEEEARIDRFCVAYVEAKREYEAHCEALRRIAKEKEEQRVAKRAAQKQRLTGVVFQKLESHFAGFQYESHILNRDWNYNHAAFYFHHWPSTFALGRLIQAPSYATQKKITEAATRAKWLYTRLEDLGFLGDAFPSQLQRWLRAHGNLPMHKKALVRYFAEFKSSLSMLPSDSCWNVSALSIYEAMLQEDRAKMVLEVLSPEECRDAFANEVTRETNRNSSRQKRLQLATRIWTIHNTQQWNRERLFRYSASDLGLYGQRFSVARTDFNQTLRKIIRYKKHPDTKAWIRQTISSGNFSALLTPGVSSSALYSSNIYSWVN